MLREDDTLRGNLKAYRQVSELSYSNCCYDDGCLSPYEVPGGKGKFHLKRLGMLDRRFELIS